MAPEDGLESDASRRAHILGVGGNQDQLVGCLGVKLRRNSAHEPAFRARQAHVRSGGDTSPCGRRVAVSILVWRIHGFGATTALRAGDWDTEGVARGDPARGREGRQAGDPPLGSMLPRPGQPHTDSYHANLARLCREHRVVCGHAVARLQTAVQRLPLAPIHPPSMRALWLPCRYLYSLHRVRHHGRD